MFGRFIVKEMPFQDLFLLEQAKRIKDAVKIPVAYIGGVLSVDDMEKAMKEGFEFVQIGRATVRDPDVIKKMHPVKFPAWTATIATDVSPQWQHKV